MKKTIKIVCYSFIGISCLSLLYVALLAWADPRGVMELVQVELNNNDALSSIRGVYGGVGISLVVLLIALARKSIVSCLLFLTMFWWLYAFSRLLTIMSDGPLGEFGTNWITIESVFGLIALVLYLTARKKPAHS